MRWISKTPKEPKDDDVRKRMVFAWLPTRINSTHVVWLERYAVTEVFCLPRSGAPGWWSETGRNLLDTYY